MEKYISLLGFPPIYYVGTALLRFTPEMVSVRGMSLMRGSRLGRTLRSAGKMFRVGEHVTVIGRKTIQVGYDVTIYDHCFLCSSKSIVIGDRTHIDCFTSVYGHGGVEIGADCAIAAGVRIYSQSNRHDMSHDLPPALQERVYAPVKIGNGVWIGANAVIFPGVSIGDGTVIGAGSLVNKDIPPFVVAVGAPARVIQRRKDIAN